MTRAALLKAGVACGLVALTARAEGVVRLSAWRPWTDARRHLHRSSYAAHLNTTFRIRQDGARPLALRLEQISDLPGSSSSGAEEQFALLFSGPSGAAFRQDRRHVVEHSALGRFRLAVFPVGRPNPRQHYEAIVNRRAAS
jgi:hypothetical protein